MHAIATNRLKLVIAGVLALAAVIASAAAARTPAKHAGPKPTIVLVHGAWADSSSWSDVIRRLQQEGFTVRAPGNPLRGLVSDAANIARFLNTISGPIVLVGHSYGGAVITNAATGNKNVKALVYIDAFIPDKGEKVLELAGPDSAFAVDPTTVFDFVPNPDGPPGDVDLYLKPRVVADSFANDLPAKTAAVIYATQRPLALSAGFTPSGEPAWKTIPSWALIGTDDKAIPASAQRFMANRAHAHVVEIKSSHVSLISHPRAVADIIDDAADSVSP